MFGFRKTARALIDMGERRSTKHANRDTHYHTHYHGCCPDCPRRKAPPLRIAPGTEPDCDLTAAELDAISDQL